MAQEGTVCVMAKEPQPGKVKTRLCPPLEPSAAAELHAAFVRDTVLRLAGRRRWRVVLAASPDGNAPRLAELAAQSSVTFCWQGSGDLGERMQRVLEKFCGRDSKALVLGADTPDLPLSYIEAAFSALDSSRAVLGPATDGGYYLLGSIGVVPPVFRLDRPWGTSEIFDATLRALIESRVATTVLAPWKDVDDAAALDDLRRRLDDAANARRALPATCAELNRCWPGGPLS